MVNIIIHAVILILVLSIVFPVWMIYRKTKSKAELLIAIGFSVLALIRLGILVGWDIISDGSQEWTIFNTAIIASGYWWLFFSLQNFSIGDKKELQQFRDDSQQVSNEHEELGHYIDAQPGVSRDHTELSHYRDDQPGVEADKVELQDFRTNNIQVHEDLAKFQKAQPGIDKDEKELSVFKEEQPRVEERKEELREFRQNESQVTAEHNELEERRTHDANQ